MNLRSKLLIALLTTTVAAGAAGVAACTKQPNEQNPGPTPSIPDKTVTASDDAYEIAVANGFKGDKDEWIAELKVSYNTADKEIKKVDAKADGDILITYSDDTTQTVAMTVKIYKVICKDNVSGEPLAGAWFEIGYMIGYTFTNTDSAANRYAQSDSNGVASFYVTPVSEMQYIVKIADPNLLASYLETSTIPAVIPAKYSVAFGTTELGFAVTQLSFDGNRTTEALFANSANNFYEAEKVQIPYTRTPNGESNGTLNGAFKLSVEANVYRYIYFKSYVAADTAQHDAAVTAATGKYKFTVTPADGAVLYNFTGTSSYAPLNDKNIPSTVEYVTGGTAGAIYKNDNTADGYYTGTNSITLNITKNDVQGEKLFGILSDKDVEITITVERLGDAEENDEIPVTKLTAPANIAKYAEKPKNTNLTLMPVTGAVKAVKGNDGYYHVGSADGPVLLVQLNKALARVAPVAISQLPSQRPTELDDPLGDAALTFNVIENGKVVAIYNYTDVIAAYSAQANNDGVYGVDDMLYNFLVHYSNSTSAIGYVPGSEYNWLLPCQYYQPDGGMPVTGGGTQDNPYVLMTGTNGLSLSGTAYLTFSAPETGIYSFAVKSGTISCTSSLLASVTTDKLYVCVTSVNAPVTLSLSGSGTTSVTVEQYERTVTAEYDDDKQTTTGTQALPVTLMPGISNVVITSANNEGVWVNFKSMFVFGATQYLFEIYNDNASIVYDGESYNSKKPLILVLENSSSEFELLITAKDGNGQTVYGNFMINVREVNDSDISSSELNLGNNTVIFKNDGEAFDGIVYTFTADKDGAYTLNVTEDSLALIAAEDDFWFENPFISASEGICSYTFEAKSGQTVSFLIAKYEGSDAFIVTIEEGGEVETPITLGEQKNISIHEGGTYSSSFETTTAGTYTVEVKLQSAQADLEITAYYKGSGDRAPAKAVKLQLTGNSYTVEFTLSEEDVAYGPEIIFELEATQQINATLTVSKK